jgi:hypothetical protein
MVKNTNLLGYRYRNNGKPLFALSNVQKKAKSEIERKITDGVYSFELVSCPICEKQNGYELLAEKDRYGLPCNTVICKTCGLLITNPAMDKDSLTQFYSEDYRELYTGSAIAQTYFFSNQYKQGKQIVDFF